MHPCLVLTYINDHIFLDLLLSINVILVRFIHMDSYLVNVPTLMLRCICVVSRCRLLCFNEYSSIYLKNVKLLNYRIHVCSSLTRQCQMVSESGCKTHSQHVALCFSVSVTPVGVCWSHFVFALITIMVDYLVFCFFLWDHRCILLAPA